MLLITDPNYLEKEEESLIQLLDQGLSRLHIRKPRWGVTEIRTLVNAIPVEYYSKISLHGDLKLATDLGLGGCHFKSNQKILASSLRKSKSFHHLNELLEVDNSVLDYGFISPIFDSISKQGYQAAFEYNALKNWMMEHKQGLGFSVYALGGVGRSKISVVKEMGFDGAVIMGDIWKTGDLAARVSVFKEIKQELIDAK
ncbi:thiamine phosphate synthase [Echinicola marina]|uniref:thiamine phosphate synthase n=1 Tax=Echinicola marina TaxID=2859768 RepID=UPI001CF660C4|nr:thiamine phosphate synthase [Echinicola marina]UCS92628.1 thiamine phosphate synthase [Echinicola marina]